MVTVISAVQTKRLTPKNGPITREPSTSITITSAPKSAAVRARYHNGGPAPPPPGGPGSTLEPPELGVIDRDLELLAVAVEVLPDVVGAAPDLQLVAQRLRDLLEPR